MGYWKAEIRRHLDLSKHESCRETELHHARMAEEKYNDASIVNVYISPQV